MMNYRRLVRKYAKKIYFLKYGKKLVRQPRDVKDEYDGFVEDLIDEVPVKCPVYQCGSFMKRSIRKPPKDWDNDSDYVGDEQTPDMICISCGAKYKFDGFRGRK